MKTPLSVTNIRVDDAVLLIHLFLEVRIPEILDQHFTRHGNQKGLSWGWLTTIWLAHILTQGDHRKLTVRSWVAKCRTVLSKVIGLDIQETDFTDDRLTLVLERFSDIETWHKIEESLYDAILFAYDLNPEEDIRADATTLSGFHAGGENSLFQFGKSKEHPELLCVKIMQTSQDPLGLPLSTTVVSGNKADDKLYIPAIERSIACLKRKGLLFIGDSKMSSQEIRSFLHRQGQHYLTPLALVGEIPQLMKEWVKKTVDTPHILQEIPLKTDEEEEEEKCKGYAFARDCLDLSRDTSFSWKEQVFVVYSPNYADTLRKGFEKRIQAATEKLQCLTVSEKRKKNRTEDELRKTAQTILKQHRVSGIVTYRLERIAKTSVKYIGRGRGGPDRPQTTVEMVRYDLNDVGVDQEALKTEQSVMGWRAYVSNMPASELSLTVAMEKYRKQSNAERGFHRMKGIPLSLCPLFVHRDDQVTGLIHLLSLALRFLTLIEHRVRKRLKEENTGLVGLHLENPKKESRTPTTERLLVQFREITYTIVKMDGVEMEHITPHNSLQSRILELLGLPPDIYSRLAVNSG